MKKLFVSERIFSSDGFVAGAILVGIDGKIEEIFTNHSLVQELLESEVLEIIDCGKLVLMPGLIDSHVHINEPGRTEWEGFRTATKAAAAGGFTTIVDMPLNSIPPTTTVKNLLVKQNVAFGNICTNVGFWGGIIPSNVKHLRPLLDRGVVGFKCFMCPSGVDEFPHVEREEIESALDELKGTNALVAFHAEKCDAADDGSDSCGDGDPKQYKTYLKTRPDSLEFNAIELVIELTEKYDDIRTHIVHLSTAKAIPVIQKHRAKGQSRLTVETCHHYLSLCSDNISDSRVEFKCCPPVRNRRNREELWQAIKDGTIDLVVSDHSPSTADMKLLNDCPDKGNFLKSWGGISSVQLGLSLFWTNCQKRNLTIADMVKLMCLEPANLCGFDKFKGKLAKGYDADFCIWNPEEEFTVTTGMIEFRNKANPYLGLTLKGCVYATVVNGLIAYDRNALKRFSFVGNLIERRNT